MFSLTAVFALATSALAQSTLYWYPGSEPNPGGAGTWNATTGNWSLTGVTKTPASGIPAAGDSVVFGGTGGTVTLTDSGSGVQLNDWRVDVAGYTFTRDHNQTISVNSFSGAGLSTAVFQTSSNSIRALTFDIRGDTAFNGTISGSGGAVAKRGSGRLDLSEANLIYTGNTTVNEGSVWFSSAQLDALTGSISLATAEDSSANLVVVGGGTVTRKFVIGNGDSTSAGFGARDGDVTLSFATLSDFGTAGFRPLVFTLGTSDSTHKVTLTNSLRIAADNRVLRVENGSAAIDAEVSGAFTTSIKERILTRDGAGTLLISGTTNAQLRLNQTAGTTLVDGSWTSVADNTNYGIQVGAGATLGGDGTITLSSTALNVSGTLMGGRGEGDQSLTISANVNLLSDSVLAFGLGETLSDQIIRTGGAWSFQTEQGVTLLDAGFLPTETSYALITGLADPLDVSGWSLHNSSPGIAGEFRYDGGTVYFDMIPEPSVFLLVGMGLTVLLLRRRRR